MKVYLAGGMTVMNVKGREGESYPNTFQLGNVYFLSTLGS